MIKTHKIYLIQMWSAEHMKWNRVEIKNKKTHVINTILSSCGITNGVSLTVEVYTHRDT